MIGIYFIKCLINNKTYIGSSINIEKRLKQHIKMLEKNNHSNQYLQNSYNKYGKNNFKLGIIDICKEESLSNREQYYIDNNENLFNIIKKDIKRPTLEPEIIQKITNRINEMYKTGELSKTNKGNFKKGQKPWNTGKKYKSTDHLKVPKLNKGDRSNDIITKRNKLPKILVYDINNNYLGIWNSSKDLEDNSKKENFILKKYMILRNKDGRQGYDPYLLQSVNINKSNNFNKLYKGLFFKQAHDKSDKLLENPEEDDQQPRLSLND